MEKNFVGVFSFFSYNFSFSIAEEKSQFRYFSPPMGNVLTLSMHFVANEVAHLNEEFQFILESYGGLCGHVVDVGERALFPID